MNFIINFVSKLLASNNLEILDYFRSKNIFKSTERCDFCRIRMKLVVANNIIIQFVWKCLHKTCILYENTKSVRRNFI
ncbi:hypothetical protein H311_02273 [Anncaliia algerae PRA109]|nr:hypothetical protein H311_02273 [Anncaliia algerae PRA109]